MSFLYSQSSSCFIGTLSEWNPHTGQTSNPLLIYTNDEILIGRDRKRCQYVVENPFISNKHLRVYTVIFDQESPNEVAPLVYAQDLSMNGTLWNGYMMGKGNGSFLLSDGDTLRLSLDLYLRFECEVHRGENHFDVLRSIEMKEFEDEYPVTQRMLGSGAYGQVHMAYQKETGKQLACKIVDLRALRERATEELEKQHSRFFMQPGEYTVDVDEKGTAKVIAIRDLKERKIQDKLEIYNREARILGALCHPNIIGVERVIKSSNTIYLFQDLITAGDLFSYIQYKGGKLGDIESAVIVRQVVMALDYLHEQDIVHRDLKPDNILMTSLADGCRVVLTDFGCARLLKPTIARMSTMVGTFEYSAPEVLKNRQGYTKAIDLWSLGCVTVVLLTGDSPFKDPITCSYSAKLARNCDLEKLESDMDWNKVGNRAKDFVRRLLVLDESRRMDVKEALGHGWFTNEAHRKDFEALYQRSIKDWKPRVHRGELIVNLGSFANKRAKQPERDSKLDSSYRDIENQSQQCRRDLFTDSGSSILASDSLEETFRCNSRLSPTLSDPELPPHIRTKSKHGGIDLDPSQYLSTKYQSTPEDSQAYGPYASEPPSQEQPKKNLPESNLNKPKQGQQSRALQPLLPQSFNLGSNQNSYSISKKRQDIWEIDQDEVYEEVNDSLSGKRRHVIYGTNFFAN